MDSLGSTGREVAHELGWTDQSKMRAPQPFAPPFELLVPGVDGPAGPSEKRSRAPDAHVSDAYAKAHEVSLGRWWGLWVSARPLADSLSPLPSTLLTFLPPLEHVAAEGGQACGQQKGQQHQDWGQHAGHWDGHPADKMEGDWWLSSDVGSTLGILILSPSHIPRLSQGGQRVPGTTASGWSQWKGPQPPSPAPGGTFSWL